MSYQVGCLSMYILSKKLSSIGIQYALSSDVLPNWTDVRATL